MLNDSDLNEFTRLVRHVEEETGTPPEGNPNVVLCAEELSDHLLHPNELSRLHRSLRIATIADGSSDLPANVLDLILRSLETQDRRCLPLSHAEEWLRAIRWAIARASPSIAESPKRRGRDRQHHVGTACRRLRDRDYRVDIGVFGPRLDDETRLSIARRVNSLIAQVGGTAAIEEICGLISATGNVHDGLWLLGHRPGAANHAAVPAIPVGWLLALALRHIHTPRSTSDPMGCCEQATELAVDFAASMDCQRYNQFDGFNLGATDFLQSLEESLVWRELFTLPQVPPVALTTIRHAFSQIVWSEGTDDLQCDVDDLFAELGQLLATLTVDRPTMMPKSRARSDYPLLWRHARTPRGTVNTEYLDPFGDHPCNHDRCVFFEVDDERLLVLPPALTAAAACVAIFTSVRKKAEDAVASEIVGAAMEKAVAIACRAHTQCVDERLAYKEGKTPLEIDVAVREGPELILFETKSKSLTSKARTGDTMAFLLDYTTSFLALVRQLVRHERNIKAGLTLLTRRENAMETMRITKVAVSPLCYGPSSDHVLAGSLFRSIIQARLRSTTGDPNHTEILAAFNKKLDQITRDIEQIAPDEDGEIDLFGYLIDLFWLDLGQLLYALHRGRSVFQGLSVLKNLTFGTQDYWTEAAFADRQGLAERHWHPIHASSHAGQRPGS